MRRKLLGATTCFGTAFAVHSRAELSQVPLLPEDFLVQKHLFPEGRLDQDLQQVDLRGRNSWRLLMAEVSSVELLEVQLINAIAPFIINARLKPLMLRTPERDKHIVNVSAVEGQFYRNWKTTRHPHTNMAKAALNMMTRTSATDYHGDGIHMNSVDTGWVTDEDPVEIAARKTVEQRFHPPLDIVDGAARILDPIISGIQHRRTRVGTVSEGLPADGLVIRHPLSHPRPYWTRPWVFILPSNFARSIGFVRYASQRFLKHRLTSLMLVTAVVIMIFAPLAATMPRASSSARTWRTASCPSISGIMMSMQIRSYFCPRSSAERNASTASLPLTATWHSP